MVAKGFDRFFFKALPAKKLFGELAAIGQYEAVVFKVGGHKA